MENTVKRSRLPVNAAEIIGWVCAGLVGVLVIGTALYSLLTMTNASDMVSALFGRPGSTGFLNLLNRFLSDEVFLRALSTTVTDLLVIGVGGFALSLLIALALDRLPKVVRYVVLVLLMTPLLCPGTVNTVMQLFQGDRSGMVNHLLMQLGMTTEPIIFLYHPAWIPHIVRGIQLLRSIGPGVLLISAGLQSVRDAACLEGRQRGVRSRLALFWLVTLPRMRIPLMLSAAVMLMGAIGTSAVSWKVLGFISSASGAYNLYQMLCEFLVYRDQYEYAACALAVLVLLTLVFMAVMCLLIWLVTLRPARRKLTKAPAPETLGAELPRKGGWRVVSMILSVTVVLLPCVVLLFMLLWKFGHSLMSVEDWYSFPPRILPRNPTLSWFADLDVVMADWGYQGVNLLRSLLYVLLPGLLLLGIAGFAGYGCSRRQVGWARLLMTAVALLVLLASVPIAASYLWDESERTLLYFREARHWLLWGLLLTAIPLGYSVGEMLRRNKPVKRLLWAAAAAVTLLLMLCWRGVMGGMLAYFSGSSPGSSIGFIATIAAYGAFVDLVSLLLSIPFVIGAFQLLLGTPDTRPLYRGGNE